MEILLVLVIVLVAGLAGLVFAPRGRRSRSGAVRDRPAGRD